MNYIQQINGFEQWAEVNMPSTGQYALYYALLAINNRAGWKEWFKVANSTLETRIGMSAQGIRKARSLLIEHKLIEIQIVGSNKATLYKIVPFTPQIVSATVSANYSTSEIVSATVSAEGDLPPEKFPQQFPVLKHKQDLKTETFTTTGDDDFFEPIPFQTTDAELTQVEDVYFDIHKRKFTPKEWPDVTKTVKEFGAEKIIQVMQEKSLSAVGEINSFRYYIPAIKDQEVRYRNDGFRKIPERGRGEYDKLSI